MTTSSSSSTGISDHLSNAVRVSSLGDAAVLTGALGIGLRAALDNVFSNRTRVPRQVADSQP